MKIMLLVCLAAALAIAGYDLAEAKHTPQASKPCSVQLSGQLLPVMYVEQPRNNPDGTFYPADAFYYLAWFSASPTCVGLNIAPLKSYDGLDVEFHNMTSWRLLDVDWHGPHNSWRAIHGVDPFETEVLHRHTALERNPAHLETVHYYRSVDDDAPALSIREDEQPSKSQKRQIDRILATEDHMTASTWEWDFVAGRMSHPHHPQCPPDADLGDAKSGQTVEDGPDAPCRAGDAYADQSQPLFEEAVLQRCGTVRLYSGCVFGKVVIDDRVAESKCLFAELDRMGVDRLLFPESDRCINTVQKLEQTVTGLRQTCGKNSSGATVCKSVPVPRTVELFPDILLPEMSLVLTHETLLDSDGYGARNLDGTYYVWDPVTIKHVPELKWKNHRDNTIRFEIGRGSSLNLEGTLDCHRNSCDKTLVHPGTAASRWALGNGDGLAVYNATDYSAIGLHDMEYHVTAYNGDAALASDEESTGALVVRYDPVYSEYPYPVLSDDMRTSYENRAAVALHYFGSVGGGPNDAGGLHEDRRSKVNGFDYSGVGFDPWEPVQLKGELAWSEALDVGIIPVPDAARPGTETVLTSHATTVPCNVQAHGTAMLVRAGYCKIYFEYPVLGEVVGPEGPQYENVTLSNTLVSGDFAGRERTDLSSYEYRFAEPFFHTGLSITASAGDGAAAAGNRIPVSVTVEPRTGDGHTKTLPEYMDEKTVYDTGDPGLGRIVSGDVYPTSYSESGHGHLEVKLRRVSSMFESYGNSTGNVAGADIFSLSSLYLDSGNARLEVPLDVGLGSLSPLSVAVSAGGMTRDYDYDYVDFGRDSHIRINLAKDNPLEVARHPGSVTVTPAPGFGEIERLYVNGTAVDAACAASCVIGTQDDSALEITAENFWGGQAHAVSPGLGSEVLQAPVPASNMVPLALFSLLAVPLYWLYRRIRGAQ